MSYWKSLAVVARRSILCLSLPLSVAAQDLPPNVPDVEPIGNSTFQVVGQAVAGATVDASLIFAPGISLPEGTVMTLRQHWLDEVRLQHDSPEAAAYVSIEGVDDVLKTNEKVFGVEGGLDVPTQAPGFQLVGFGLEAGTEVRFSVANLELPKVAGHLFSLVVYVQLPDQQPVRIPGNRIRVRASDFSQISVFASSLVDPGEDINLRVRMEDRFGNLVETRPLSLDLRVNGMFRQRTELEQSVSLVPGVSFETPGSYRVELRTGGGGIRAFSNPIRVGTHDSDIFWVDFGAVTSASTGYLGHEDVLANGAGQFDLVLPADHDAHIPGSAGLLADGVAMFRLAQPESVVRLIDDSGVLVDVAQPELITDLRRFTLENLRLAQVVAGPGHHLWLGHRAAKQGFPIGFVGSSYSRQYPADKPGVYTAVFASADDWFEAMRAGRTYVSIGERMVLLPRTRTRDLSTIRDIEFEIVAGNAISRVILFKNGEIEDVRQGVVTEEGRYELSFFSASRPLSDMLSPPRNAREWVGYIASRDATVLASETMGFRLNQQSPNRVDFLTKTHGRHRALPLYLNDATQDTVLEIGIAPGFEDAAWLPQDRLPQETPMQRYVIPLSGLDDTTAGAVRSMEVAGYSDEINLRPGRESLSEDGSYRYQYEDRSVPRIGDYYYLKVELENGGVAYSSPIFIGL